MAQETLAPEIKAADALSAELPFLTAAEKEALNAYFAGRVIREVAQEARSVKAALGKDIKYTPGAEYDRLAAQVLMDKITLSAARRRLRINKNRAAINRFKTALKLTDADTRMLLNSCASLSAPMFFDEEMRAALSSPVMKDKNDEEKARLALSILKEKALACRSAAAAKKNEENILKAAQEYLLPVSVSNKLLTLYAVPCAVDFEKEFNKYISELSAVNKEGRFNALLAAQIMLGRFEPQDAYSACELSKEIKYFLSDADFLTLSCRYGSGKNAGAVAVTLEEVLKRLPYADAKEENLGLAVSVLLAGTQEAMTEALEKAQKFKERTLYKKQLNRHDAFEGFVHQIAKKYTGVKGVPQVLEEFESVIKELPFCSSEKENKDLACKIMLGHISKEEGVSQARFRRNIRAAELTAGLAPGVLKKYLGTQSSDEVLEFFKERLKPYSFWMTDENMHLAALEALVAELNGARSSDEAEAELRALQSSADAPPVS